MFERKVTPDEHVIDQGDDGDNFYVVDRYDLCIIETSLTFSLFTKCHIVSLALHLK